MTEKENKLIYKNYKKYRLYTYKSGKLIILLGYEDIALDYYILNLYDENDIENSIKFMNSLNIIYTTDDNKTHHYIPDFYIKSENKIIEVKSEFTFYKDLNKNCKKVKAAIEKGFDIIVIVFTYVNRKKQIIKYKLYTYEDIKIEVEKYYK